MYVALDRRAIASGLGAFVLAGLSLTRIAPANAEPSAANKTLATVLFREGRGLLAEGRISEACLKLVESQRLDPSGGTILNVALCHEQEGRLALSWSEFNESIAFARRDARRDREDAAAQHIRALEPRLSRLTISVAEPARLEGLRVECDGHELAPASWSVGIPVDGPEHVVRASAPGHEPFTTTIAIAAESGTATVEIPALKAATATAPMTMTMTTLAPSTPAERSLDLSLKRSESPDASAITTARGGTTHRVRRRISWAVGAAGIAQVGFASYFGLRAFDLHGKGEDDPAGQAADKSTVLWMGGLATLAAGVYLFLTSRDEQPATAPAVAADLAATLAATPPK